MGKNKVLLPKSSVPSKSPIASAMTFGELYVNYASGTNEAFLATKKYDGTIAKFHEGGEANVKSDWNQFNSFDNSFISNKTHYACWSKEIQDTSSFFNDAIVTFIDKKSTTIQFSPSTKFITMFGEDIDDDYWLLSILSKMVRISINNVIILDKEKGIGPEQWLSLYDQTPDTLNYGNFKIVEALYGNVLPPDYNVDETWCIYTSSLFSGYFLATEANLNLQLNELVQIDASGYVPTHVTQLPDEFLNYKKIETRYVNYFNKLNSIESGAQVNGNAFKTIKTVDNLLTTATTSAANSADTFTISAGTNITLSLSNNAKGILISSTNTIPGTLDTKSKDSLDPAIENLTDSIYLHEVSKTGDYRALNHLPTIGDGVLSIQTGQTPSLGSFSANQTGNSNIILHKVVATGNISDLNNDAGYITPINLEAGQNIGISLNDNQITISASCGNVMIRKFTNFSN